MLDSIGKTTTIKESFKAPFLFEMFKAFNNVIFANLNNSRAFGGLTKQFIGPNAAARRAAAGFNSACVWNFKRE